MIFHRCHFHSCPNPACPSPYPPSSRNSVIFCTLPLSSFWHPGLRHATRWGWFLFLGPWPVPQHETKRTESDNERERNESWWTRQHTRRLQCVTVREIRNRIRRRWVWDVAGVVWVGLRSEGIWERSAAGSSTFPPFKELSELRRCGIFISCKIWYFQAMPL